MAALELLAERGFPLDATLTFEHREGAGGWTVDGARTMREMLGEVFWSGRFYAAERGATVIDARTGNVTSPRELAECLRRAFSTNAAGISSHALEVACVDDAAQSGKRFILVPVIAAGDDTRPGRGQVPIGKMARAIGEWVRTLPSASRP